MGLEILYLLIPATFVLAAIALILFVWAIHTGQFDDLETPAIRVLFDDEPGPRGAQGSGSAPVIEPAHPPVKRLA
jgi:cbb3-type cytochrome oxidase maturation protein